jgi:hypothetical protein
MLGGNKIESCSEWVRVKGEREQTSRGNGTCLVLIFSSGGGARKNEVKFLSLGVTYSRVDPGLVGTWAFENFRAGTLPRA